jgi:hypothetical protein
VWVSTWRPQAQNRPELAAASANAVQRLDVNARRQAPANPADRGATYHWIEERAVRTTTRFGDAVAIAERVAGGDLKTRLADAAGNELAVLVVDRLAADGAAISFQTPEGNQLRAAGRAGLRPTLEWSNRQAYLLWKDRGADPDGNLEWREDLIRVRGRNRIDLDARTGEVKTEWPDGLAAVTKRSTGARRHPLTGAAVRGTWLESRLTRDGTQVGQSRWYREEQTLVWSFPGLTTGYLDADRLKEIGGWTFTPDLQWTNIQSYAFHHFHDLVATQGFVAARESPPAGWLTRLANSVSPTLSANEPGCDGLHWLDGSIVRPCCDAHDLCYEKYGCTWKSWWTWWSSWKCTGCNIAVVFCINSRFPPFSQQYP